MQADSPTFAELGVRPEIVAALAEAGIERTFAIQELTLPLALAGEDVIGQARTGMGKTLGFGVPLLQRVTPPSEQPAADVDGEAADRTKDVPQALVVVPTRELCVQVAKDLADAGAKLGVRVTAIYGGRAYEPQLAALRKGVDVVVGTPGRLLDLAEQRHLVLGRVKALVLDEADEMLDLGFLPDVERIMRMLPEQRHTMLFSATMPGPIIALSRAFLNRPTHIRAEEADQGSIHERTTQLVYRAHAMDKVELLTRVLQAKDRGLTMIFARTKRTVQRVADDLAERGFAAAAVHGDLGQGAREQALRAFRSGKVDVLVATDVAARGIDVTDVTHVVELPVPRRRQDLRPPDRPHRPGRQDRRRGHARRLGRAPQVEDDQRRPRARHAGGPGDLLHLGAPLHRPRDPGRRHAGACRLGSAPGPGWTPSTSTPRATRAAGAGATGDRRPGATPGRRGAARASAPLPLPHAQPRRRHARRGRRAGGGRADRRRRVDAPAGRRARARGDDRRIERRRRRRRGVGRTASRAAVAVVEARAAGVPATPPAPPTPDVGGDSGRRSQLADAPGPAARSAGSRRPSGAAGRTSSWPGPSAVVVALVAAADVGDRAAHHGTVSTPAAAPVAAPPEADGGPGRVHRGVAGARAARRRSRSWPVPSS